MVFVSFEDLEDSLGCSGGVWGLGNAAAGAAFGNATIMRITVEVILPVILLTVK